MRKQTASYWWGDLPAGIERSNFPIDACWGQIALTADYKMVYQLPKPFKIFNTRNISNASSNWLLVPQGGFDSFDNALRKTGMGVIPYNEALQAFYVAKEGSPLRHWVSDKTTHCYIG